jgi:formylglycine-generating enzyme required for sulfatase activity
LNSLFLRTVLVVLAASALAGAQDTGADRYESTFGAEERAAKQSPSAATDIKFANKLLKAARATSSRSYRAQLYEKVYEFSGKRSGGYKQAIEAIDYLTRAVPARRNEWLEKKLKTMTTRYVNSFGTGKAQIAESYLATMLDVAANKLAEGKPVDAERIYRSAFPIALKAKSPLLAEIREKSAELSAVAALERKTAQLKRAFAAKPTVRNRENLIYHHLAELDNAADAAELLAEGLDAKLAANLTLITTPAAVMTPTQRLGLAGWCESLVRRPLSTKGKVNVMQRAREHYSKFLAVGDMTDAEAALAKRSVARLDKLIDKLDPSGLSLDCGGGVRMLLKRMKKGKFMIGSPADEKGRGSDEGPQILVEITKVFYIGVTEVTQKQYEAVMGAAANASSFKGPQHPATGVSQINAKMFCSKLSVLSKRTVRLPTEAEWEYACRAGSSTAYCFGDDVAELGVYAWTSKNSAVDKKLQPHAVRTKKANAFGLFDMHGNVREMVLRPYASGSYNGADKISPQDPSICRSNLQGRGGSAGRDTSFCRSANRTAVATNGDSLTGFRVIVEPKKASALR